MKKLFTLILMALAIVTGAKAQATKDIDISTGWGWGYSSTTTYEDGVMTITLTGNWGAGSTGWDSGADWSKYNKLTVVIDSYTNDWGKVYFTSTEKGSDNKNITIAEQSFSTITSQKEVVVNFDPTKATSVYQLSIQGKAADDVIKVSRVYLTEAVSYEEKELTLTDGNHILSSEFDAYDDDYEVKLTITNTTDPYASRDGWGIGDIFNIDNWSKDTPSDPYLLHLTAKAGTEFYLYTTIGELKKIAKNNGDEYFVSPNNRTGVTLNIYNDCKLSKATVLIPQSDSPSFSAVTISSTLSGTNENIPVVANGEELFADLSDEATNDFVINSITITPVGSFQGVQGQFRLTSEDGSTQILPTSSGFETVPFTYDSTDDVWKAEDLDLEVAGGQELEANTNYILEFYFEGSTDGNTYDYTYKNGENNFKVKFQNGTPAVQFKAENTATMTLNVDGTATTINFNKDGSVYNNGNDDLGEVSVLSITGFTTTVISSVAVSSNLQCWITTADGTASTQEQGGMYTNNVTTSGDEQSFTATVTNTDIISITADGIGLTDGETYILHGYFQVMDNDENYYFAPNWDNGESFAIQFTYKAPAFTGASINLTTGDTAEDITLTDNMTEAVSYENVEKFIINSVSATTVGSVSNATLYYYIYTDDTWDNQVRTLPLTNDGSGNWTATMNQDFVQAFGWTSGHAYAINFYFLGDDGNGGTVAWNNSDNEYWVNITVKETSTGINGISTDEADENEEIYNIAGQKVGKNYKGLVIKNGKKQIVK